MKNEVAPVYEAVTVEITIRNELALVYEAVTVEITIKKNELAPRLLGSENISIP